MVTEGKNKANWGWQLVSSFAAEPSDKPLEIQIAACAGSIWETID